MKLKSIFITLSLLSALMVFASCSTQLLNKAVDPTSEKVGGIPWVESREYDVYVFEGTEKKAEADPGFKTLYFKRHTLGDKVNNYTDKSRKKWATNYRSAPFASGSLGVDLDGTGDLKKAMITSKDGTANAADAGAAILEAAPE